MLRQERERSTSCCKDFFSQLCRSIKRAIYKFRRNSSHHPQSSSSTSPQTILGTNMIQQKNQNKDFLQNFQIYKTAHRSNSMVWQHLVYQQQEIRNTLKYFGLFLICQVAIIVGCFYFSDASSSESISEESSSNPETSGEKEDQALEIKGIILNLMMIFLSIIYYYLLKHNGKRIGYGPGNTRILPLLYRFSYLIKFLTFFFFTAFSLAKCYIEENIEISNLEALIFIVTHQCLQKESQFLSYAMSILLGANVIRNMAVNQQSITTILIASFLLCSLLLLSYKCVVNIEICKCSSLKISRSSKEENENPDLSNSENEDPQEIQRGMQYKQGSRILKKGICCLKCRKPFKHVARNFYQLECEVMDVMAENYNLGQILDCMPQGYCIIDRKQQKVVKANTSLLNKAGIIDCEMLYKQLSELRIKIGNSYSLTELEQKQQKKHLHSNSTNTNRHGQQFFKYNNNNGRVISSGLEKSYQNYTMNGRKTLAYQNQLQASYNYQNNHYSLKQQQGFQLQQQQQFQQQQQQQYTQFQEGEEGDYNNINLNYSHMSQSHLDEAAYARAALEESKKCLKTPQIKSPCLSSNGNNLTMMKQLQQQILLHNAISQEQYKEKRSISQENDEYSKLQLNNEKEYSSNLQNNNLIFRQQIKLAQADKQFQSFDIGSVNFTNEASPIPQLNPLFLPLEKELVSNCYFTQTNNNKGINYRQGLNDQQQLILTTNLKTDDGLNPFNQVNMYNERNKSINLQNINESDHSNLLSVEQNRASPYLGKTSYTPQSQMKILNNNSNNPQDNSDFNQNLKILSQQIIKHHLSDGKKSDQSKFEQFHLRQNHLLHSVNNGKQNYNSFNKLYAKRKSSSKYETNRKRGLTENIVLPRGDINQETNGYNNNCNINLLNQQNDNKRDIHTTYSYSPFSQMNNGNSNILGGGQFNHIPSDYDPTNGTYNNSISIEDYFNIPILQLNSKYTFRLLEPLGEFRSVKIIKQSEEIFSFIFDEQENRQFLEQELLKELENFQTKVLKSISHEFGTPLNCAVNMLKLCQMNVDETINQNYVLPALSSIRILKFSCRDFIDYSKIQFNTFKLEIKPTYLKNMLQKVVEYFQPLMQTQTQQGKEKIQLIYQYDQLQDECIQSDPQRIMQVIFNLLTNALKFTKVGFIQIKAISLTSNEVEISVQDSGEGVKQDKQENLFERKTIINKEQETSGLGLLISNIIAQRLSYSGTGLTLQSEENKGSTFSFTLSTNCTQEGFKRLEGQKRNNKNQSQSEYNSITEFNQTCQIIPQQSINNQFSIVQINQQPISPLTNFNKNKLSISNNGIELFVKDQLVADLQSIAKGSNTNPQSEFVSQCNLSAAGDEASINEFTPNRRFQRVPKLFIVNPSISTPNKPVNQEQENEGFGDYLGMNDIDGVAKSTDRGNSNTGLDEICGKKMNIQNFSTKFITNINNNNNNESRKLSFESGDEQTSNKKLEQLNGENNVTENGKQQRKKGSLEKNMQSIPQLGHQNSNVQIGSTTSIKYPKQNLISQSTQAFEIDNQQQTLVVLNQEWIQKDNKIQPNIDIQQPDMKKNQNSFRKHPSQGFYQTNEEKEEEEEDGKTDTYQQRNSVKSHQQFPTISPNENKYTGAGILNHQKRNASPIQKKISFSNTVSPNSQMNNHLKFSPIREDGPEYNQSSLEQSQSYPNQQSQVYNQSQFSQKQIHNSSKQILSPDKLKHTLKQLSQDLKRIKSEPNPTLKEGGKLLLNTFNINPSYTIIEDSKSSEVQISQNSRPLIRMQLANDFSRQEQLTFCSQDQIPQVCSLKKDNLNGYQNILQLSPIQTTTNNNFNMCDTSLTDQIDQLDQQNYEVEEGLNIEIDQNQITPQLAPVISSTVMSNQNTSNYSQRFQPLPENTYLSKNGRPLPAPLNLSQGFNTIKQSNFNTLQISEQLHQLNYNIQNNGIYQNMSSAPKINQTFCLSPAKIKSIQLETPLSAGFQKKSKHFSQQNILPAVLTNFKRQNDSICLSSRHCLSPLKNYSERLIGCNDTLPPMSSKLIQSKQSVKQMAVQDHQNRVNGVGQQEDDIEIVSPLRTKCFSLQESYYYTKNLEQSEESSRSGQTSPIKITRRTARQRTRSEFGVQKNIQEIKEALKNKQCNCPDILIADDTQMNRHTLKLMIQSRFQFTIDEATNGQEAVDKVEEMAKGENHCTMYKMIFMDIDMPKLNGYEATQKINEIFQQKNIFCPVIAHTAFDRSEVQEEMNQCNMTDYAGKPISTAIIEQLFARYIDIASINGDV